jgi:hypothetical protein
MKKNKQIKKKSKQNAHLQTLSRVIESCSCWYGPFIIYDIACYNPLVSTNKTAPIQFPRLTNNPSLRIPN